MTNKNENALKIVGMFAPLFVSCVLLAAQWGSVTTKMQIFETSLKEVVKNMEKTDEKTAAAIQKSNDTLVELQKDMAFVRGEMKKDAR